jgi:hypothetical protein
VKKRKITGRKKKKKEGKITNGENEETERRGVEERK